MKNIFKTALFSLSILTLAACGEDEAASDGGIDTGDVKGDIDLMGADGGPMNYSLNGESSKAYRVQIGDEAEFTIFPFDKSFEEEKEKIERKTESSFDDVEIISSTDDCIFWKETKVPFGVDEKEEKTGYGFIRIIKKDDKINYVLESNGKTPLDPIWKKADAEKLLKIAQSFIPKK